jgi:hypothetical protein
MIDYSAETGSLDHCPACGTLSVRMEDGYTVVARIIATGALCAHSYEERTAMAERALATLRQDAQRDRAAARGRRPRKDARRDEPTGLLHGIVVPDASRACRREGRSSSG